MLPVLVGICLALAVGLYARVVGLDRDRAFYPTVLAVIAMIYSLFAVMGASNQALLLESAAGLVFLVAVAVGFRRNLWIIVAGLVAHGLFDFVHAGLIDNPGVPAFWPPFCLAYDAAAGALLALMLLRTGHWGGSQLGTGSLRADSSR